MSALPGDRRLFIYWRVAASDAHVAAAAVQALHSQWRALYPGLRAKLFVREDLAIADTTLMEAYAMEDGVSNGGVSPELQASIEAAAEATTRVWRHGQRHVEVFNLCGE